MERAARWLIRNWGRLVAVLVVLAALAGWRASRLEFDFAFRHFFLAHPEDELAADLRRRFGDNAGSYLVAVLQGTDVFTPRALLAVSEISDSVAAIPHVRQVFSLATVPYLRGNGTDLSLEPLAGLAEDGTDLARIRRDVLASPLYHRRLVSPDGRATVVLALVDPDHRGIAARAPTIAAFQEAVATRLPPGLTALFTGYPVTEAEYAQTVLRGFAVAQVVGLTLMALALYLIFRTVPAVVLPLVKVGIATVLVMGLMQLSGQRLTFTNASVPLMMLVIGVAEVSFLVSRYYEEAAVGWTADTAAQAAASALWPGFIAACTTSAGFLALGSGQIGLTRDFGLNMSVASLVTFAVAAALIPGALARLGRPPARALRAIEGGPITRLLERVARAIVARPRRVAVGAALLCLVAALGIPRITLDQYATRELASDHPIRAAQRVVDEQLSGAFQTHVAVRAPNGGTLATPERLRAISALEDFLARDPNVVKAWSVADYVKELHHAVAQGGAGERTIPDDPEVIAQYLLLLASAGGGSDLPMLIDPTHRLGSIVLGTTDLGTDTLRALRQRADAFVQAELGGALELRFVGDYWEITRGNEVLARDQVVMTLSSFVLIFVFVGLFLRSWKLTLLCIPPNLVPLLGALGLMGWAGFALRTGTSIILPVSLGIAVDNTTHLLTRIREEWERDGQYPAAVRRALVGTGYGMVSSTLALVLGFCAYQVPAFRSFNEVGILASWTMVLALAANLCLTPLLVLWTRPFGDRRPAAAPAATRPPADERLESVS